MLSWQMKLSNASSRWSLIKSKFLKIWTTYLHNYNFMKMLLSRNSGELAYTEVKMLIFRTLEYLSLGRVRVISRSIQHINW